MNLLFIGDIVGPDATAWLAARLPELRRVHAVDLVVANAENCFVSNRELGSAFGMTRELIERLVTSGVDVVTSGNHAWDSTETDWVLAHPRVLRPHNVPRGRPGRGLVTVRVNGEPVSVLNLADSHAIPDASPAYPAWETAGAVGTTIVDFHGAQVAQKWGFACAADGAVAAVLGTHTHEPTLALHRLPRGTGFVVDVGMTGPSGGWGGMDPAPLVAQVKGGDLAARQPVALATGPMVLGAVLLRIEGGRTTELTRLH